MPQSLGKNEILSKGPNTFVFPEKEKPNPGLSRCFLCLTARSQLSAMRRPVLPIPSHSSRVAPPEFSGIRQTALYRLRIHTALFWQQMRSEFGPAHLTPLFSPEFGPGQLRVLTPLIFKCDLKSKMPGRDVERQILKSNLGVKMIIVSRAVHITGNLPFEASRQTDFRDAVNTPAYSQNDPTMVLRCPKNKALLLCNPVNDLGLHVSASYEQTNNN